MDESIPEELNERARQVIDANQYKTLGEGRAVYIAATAEVVPDDELPQACAEAFATLKAGVRAYRP